MNNAPNHTIPSFALQSLCSSVLVRLCSLTLGKMAVVASMESCILLLSSLIYFHGKQHLMTYLKVAQGIAHLHNDLPTAATAAVYILNARFIHQNVWIMKTDSAANFEFPAGKATTFLIGSRDARRKERRESKHPFLWWSISNVVIRRANATLFLSRRKKKEIELDWRDYWRLRSGAMF